MKRNDNKNIKYSFQVMYLNIFGRSIHFLHVILIGFLLFAFGYIMKGSIESAYIAFNGISTKGIITDIGYSGSKGVEDYYYNFMYNGKVYFNSTIHLSKQIGDSVEVVFIKDDPTQNRLRERLESTYRFFLKRNHNLKLNPPQSHSKRTLRRRYLTSLCSESPGG
jgi:hypothetical protein